MANWQTFAQMEPKLAAYGKGRLLSGIAYLATIRKDGAPRLHPVTPIIGDGHLFVFMEATSPKGHDLRRDGRYVLHCSVENSSGGQGEFSIRGCAILVEDEALRALAAEAATYTPKAGYILFELGVEEAFSTVYKDGTPLHQRWKTE